MRKPNCVDIYVSATPRAGGVDQTMFEYWIRFAPTVSAKLGLEPRVIILAHDIVCSVMGSAWIDEQSEQQGTSTYSIVNTHPLYTALTGRTEGCVLEVLHLAAYFQVFQRDPGFNKVINSLKNAGTYHPTIVELDLAWKFRNAGASVRLFPITKNGVADFAAIVNAVEYVVEVSGFPSDSLRDETSSFLSAISRTFTSAVKRAEITVPVSLELNVDDVRAPSREATFKAVKEVVQAFRQDAVDRVEREFEFGTVVMRPTIVGEGPTGDSKWTAAVRSGRAPLAQSKILGDTDYAIRNLGSWVYLHDRTKDLDPYVRLRNKLKAEARQLSGCSDALIVLDIEALGVHVINDRARLEPVISEFARQHRSTTAIATVVRTWRDDGRQRGLSGHYFPLASTALPSSFWHAVKTVDEESNLLNELRNLGS